jgi:hypothetical protein
MGWPRPGGLPPVAGAQARAAPVGPGPDCANAQSGRPPRWGSMPQQAAPGSARTELRCVWRSAETHDAEFVFHDLTDDEVLAEFLVSGMGRPLPGGLPPVAGAQARAVPVGPGPDCANAQSGRPPRWGSMPQQAAPGSARTELRCVWRSAETHDADGGFRIP